VPFTGVIQGSDGNFYGTTSDTNTLTTSRHVYKLTPDGTITALHVFDGVSGTLAGEAPKTALVQGSDGSTPTASSTRYTGPITVSKTETTKAIAVSGGNQNSAVATAAYTITQSGGGGGGSGSSGGGSSSAVSSGGGGASSPAMLLMLAIGLLVRRRWTSTSLRY